MQILASFIGSQVQVETFFFGGIMVIGMLVLGLGILGSQNSEDAIASDENSSTARNETE